MRFPIILSCASALILTACGGGGGGSAGVAATSGGAGSGSGDSIGGTGAKGIIQSGIVNVYGFDNSGNVDRSNPLGNQVITGTDGSYRVLLSDDYESGTAVLVEITSDGVSTTMTCDMNVCQRDANGNPIVTFGETYPLGSNFSMSALVPGARGDTTANITPLTTAAAEIGIDRIAAGDEPTAAADSANRQLANRMGLPASSDLTELPVIDITRPDAINSADSETLEYTLKAVAAVQAAYEEAGNGAALEDALTDLKHQFADRGIADNEGGFDSRDVSLAEVLEEAKKLAELMQSSDGVISDDLTLAAASLSNEASAAATSDNTQPSQGVAPTASAPEGLQAAKRLVTTLRDISASVGSIAGDDEAFPEHARLIDDTLSEDTKHVAEAVTRAAYAMGAARDAFAADESIRMHSAYGVDVFISVNPASAVVTFSSQGVVDAIDEHNGTPVSVVVGLTGIATLSALTGAPMELYGSADSDAMRLSMHSGYVVFGEQSQTSVVNSAGTLAVEEAPRHLAMELSVTLAKNDAGTATGTAIFEGEMSLSIDSHLSQASTVMAVEELDFSLLGNVRNSIDESIAARLSARLRTAGDSCHDTSGAVATDGTTASAACHFDGSDGAPESSFGDASVSLHFETNVSGIGEPVRVELGATHSGFNNGDVEMSFRFADRVLELDYAADDGSLTISDEIGTRLELFERAASSTGIASQVLYGSITHEGVQYAALDNQLGHLAVHYTDGSTEALD